MMMMRCRSLCVLLQLMSTIVSSYSITRTQFKHSDIDIQAKMTTRNQQKQKRELMSSRKLDEENQNATGISSSSSKLSTESNTTNDDDDDVNRCNSLVLTTPGFVIILDQYIEEISLRTFLEKYIASITDLALMQYTSADSSSSSQTTIMNSNSIVEYVTLNGTPAMIEYYRFQYSGIIGINSTNLFASCNNNTSTTTNISSSSSIESIINQEQNHFISTIYTAQKDGLLNQALLLEKLNQYSFLTSSSNNSTTSINNVQLYFMSIDNNNDNNNNVFDNDNTTGTTSSTNQQQQSSGKNHTKESGHNNSTKIDHDNDEKGKVVIVHRDDDDNNTNTEDSNRTSQYNMTNESTDSSNTTTNTTTNAMNQDNNDNQNTVALFILFIIGTIAFGGGSLTLIYVFYLAYMSRDEYKSSLQCPQKDDDDDNVDSEDDMVVVNLPLGGEGIHHINYINPYPTTTTTTLTNTFQENNDSCDNVNNYSLSINNNERKKEYFCDKINLATVVSSSSRTPIHSNCTNVDISISTSSSNGDECSSVSSSSASSSASSSSKTTESSNKLLYHACQGGNDKINLLMGYDSNLDENDVVTIDGSTFSMY